MPDDQPDSWAIALAGALIVLGFVAVFTNQLALAIVFRLGAAAMIAWALIHGRGGCSNS